MAKSAKVVIGANYGDEGKGLMTDYFAAQGDNSLVVRFNGGCQASHTVTTPDGKRHAFSHFGSGTFAGAQTYLSRHYAVNPVLYLKERSRLLPIAGRLPRLYVDERAPVTTFFDMLVNQLVEDFRGTNRHGSCGMGFGETIGRHEGKAFALVAKDLHDVDTLRQKLILIRDSHLPARCRELGLPDFGQHHDLCTSDVLVNAFIEASQEFLADVTLVSGAGTLIAQAGTVVFEGAQGLLLDQHRGAFPYVTRSNTGLRNALEVAKEADLEALDVTYATRAYLTRHGAGPLAHELPGRPYDAVVDLTNQPNEYQGSLRFAYLDHDQLAHAIRMDLTDAAGAGVHVSARLAVSCLDQVGARARFWKGGMLLEGSVDAQVGELNDSVLRVGFCSWGPTRETMDVSGESIIAA
ncbi:adenylosuccinate synthetase [Burkholderia ubonensis]|uniref:adenylosuccinate synthetase n=1 Tax=Burkholderia ubonensis TaxID=101571 RepID=UPI0007C7D5A7|nr:adenylosuccinate synthetase [Burkholderia ubonensis]